MRKPKPAKARPSLKPKIDRITQAELSDRLHIYNIVQKAVWSLGRRLADGAVVQPGRLQAELIGTVPETFEPLTAVDATDYGMRLGPAEE